MHSLRFSWDMIGWCRRWTSTQIGVRAGDKATSVCLGCVGGVPVGYRVDLDVVPHAAENHRFIVLELVCVDSSFCLLIGLGEVLAEKFRAAFPGEVDDLDEENRKRDAMFP